MIGDESFDNSVLRYYLLNYFSSHGINFEKLDEAGIIKTSGELNLFHVLLNFLSTASHSYQEASQTAGFIIAANMFSHPGAFLPPETVNPEYTLPLPGDGQLVNLIVRERAKRNEGAIVTGGYLDGRICTIFNKKINRRDPLVIFANPLYTVAKSMGLDTAEVLDIFLPEKTEDSDYFHNARLTSGLGASLLYNPENQGSNFVYMLQESPQGAVGWGMLTKIQARYQAGLSNKKPNFPIEYTYTQYTLMKREELEKKNIKFDPKLQLPCSEDTYLVRLEYSMDAGKLPNTKLELKKAEVLNIKAIFEN